MTNNKKGELNMKLKDAIHSALYVGSMAMASTGIAGGISSAYSQEAKDNKGLAVTDAFAFTSVFAMVFTSITIDIWSDKNSNNYQKILSLLIVAQLVAGCFYAAFDHKDGAYFTGGAVAATLPFFKMAGDYQTKKIAEQQIQDNSDLINLTSI